MIRWGIIGLGAIAHKFAYGLQFAEGSELVAVASRSASKAEEFAKKYGVVRHYGDYRQLVEDTDVDVVYIATPHNYHMEHSLLSLESGKAVLCEKPIGVTSSQARTMIEVARQKGKFLMEAHWTRFLPMIVQIRELIDQGIIGDLQLVQADFGYRAEWKPDSRILNPELAGGALLDVGVYPIGLATMFFGLNPQIVRSTTVLGSTGVDEQTNILLQYESGQQANLSCAVRTNTVQEAYLYGSKGYIHVPQFWRAESATLVLDGKPPQNLSHPFVGNGYNYEANEVAACLRQGQLESGVISHEATLSIMEIVDKIRSCWIAS